MLNNFFVNIKNPFSIGRVFCLFCLLVCTVVLKAQPKLSFKKQKENFGFVKKGEVVKIEFHFINTGNEPLIITETKVECSCTSVEFPKHPVAPNQSGLIVVLFDTKTVYDRQDRTVELLSNVKPVKLRFKGVVLK